MTKRHSGRKVREGYRFLRGERRLFSMILLTYGVALVGTPYSRFFPVFATDVLHAGPSTFGLLLAAPGIGAVIAGLGIASFSRLRRRMHFVAMSVYRFFVFPDFVFFFPFAALCRCCF